jgi:hypothetical protein
MNNADSVPDRAAAVAADELRRQRAADHARTCPDPAHCPACEAAVVPVAVAISEALARRGITERRG